MIGEQEKLRDVRKGFADYQCKAPQSETQTLEEQHSKPERAEDKYGKDLVEQRDVDKQEDEKFEVIANARPAEAHMRNSTLKWKNQPIINLFDDAHVRNSFVVILLMDLVQLKNINENERLMVAVKALAIMWFYKLFDEVLTKEDIQTLKAYFTSSSSNQDIMTVIPVIDKAIGHSMRIMRKNPDRFDKLVDYQMLTFLKFSKKAKPVVLEAMMICPEYIPESWGGKDCERLFTARLAEVSSQMMLAPQENKKGPSGEKIPNKAKASKEEAKKEESKDAQKKPDNDKDKKKEEPRKTAPKEQNEAKSKMAEPTERKEKSQHKSSKPQPDAPKRAEKEGKHAESKGGLFGWIVSLFAKKSQMQQRTLN